MEKIIEIDTVINAVAFSPDGTHLISADFDGILRQWEAQTGKPVGIPWKGHKDVTSVAYSPDRTHLVSCSWYRTCQLWEAQTGKPVGAPWKGHASRVTSVAFSPDGNRLVSGSWHGTLQLWEARAGKPIGTPWKGHKGAVTSVAYSLDGTRVVSQGNMETILWPAPKMWPNILGGKLLRNLSNKEWREQVSPDIEYHEQCPGLPIPPDARTEPLTKSSTSET